MCAPPLAFFVSYGGEEEVAGAGPGVDSKPRILLMGLRRYCSVYLNSLGS